ncbi:MAG TPA: ATP-grasp domain-containing protein [Candidatus Acidoferrum sp.]|nr:ATP-grasp domain-containing protein [Candidatus Acidoferrum sp.]
MATTATILSLNKPTTQDAAIASGTCGALVMGADYRALGVARSLGRRGIPVWVVKQGGHLVAASSRFVARRVPWPEGSDERKIDFLLELGATHQLDGWMLFPTDDYTVSLVSRNHEALAQRFRPTVSPWEQLRWTCDKRLLHQLARRVRVHQPWTVWPSTREELAAIDCPFPVILKPAVRLKPNSMAIPKAWRAENRKSLLALYDEASALVSPENLLVQEIVPGGGETQFSYAALCKDGSPLASIVARRTRQYPSDFGHFSTYVESVDHSQVVEPAERLLAATRFTGLVEVEFKRDPCNGQLKVLDINPRVWGWHTLCKRAGVDFPHLLWLLFRDEPVPRLRGRAGERWMHMSADLRVAVEEILRGRLSLRAYMRSLSGPMESAIFAWDDPLPGILDLPLFAWTACKRLVSE